MKRCISCGEIFDGGAWRCPACHYEPSSGSGFVSFFSPASRPTVSFDPQAIEKLTAVEDRHFWFRQRGRLIVNMLRRFAPGMKSFLEIGCGTGYVLAAIAQAYPAVRLAGGDGIASCLEAAARRLDERVALYQMDACQIPFRAEFDAVGAFDVLEHVERDEVAIDGIFEVLRPGGVLLATVPQHPRLWSGVDDAARHYRRYRRGELDRKLVKRGFSVLLSTSFMSLLLPPMALLRLVPGRGENARTGLEVISALNALFDAVFAFEVFLIGKGARFPIGGSRLIVATRPA